MTGALRKRRLARTLMALLLGSALIAAAPVGAETCLSPYIKQLKQREKLLYLWAPPLETGGEDFLAVIDVDVASATYGKILERIPVGSEGNEAHQMGYMDDRSKIWAASLNSNRFVVFDVGTGPRHPKRPGTPPASRAR
jgi:hypothetical protein